MKGKIKCADCCFAEIDKKASEYTQKRCGKCECREECELKKSDEICEKQLLKWAAIQCICYDSEYHKALLNVSPKGDKQREVTWGGCEYGDRRCDV